MKNKVILLYISAMATIVASCSKSIDLTSPTLLPPEKFYKTEADIKLAVTGTYSLLRANYSNYYLMNELPSDNTEGRPESEVGMGLWDKLFWNASTVTFQNIWINYYNTIAQCNLVLSKSDGVTFVSTTTKAKYISEMKFIRALMYSELVRSFGEVPLILDFVSNDAQVFSYLRKPVKEIYAQIEKDLQEAEGGVPDVYPSAGDKGRVTSVAVKALLGKVYLYQKKYPQAESKLSEAVKNKNYGLMANPADVFSIANEYNKEIIFTVQYSRLLAGAGEGSHFSNSFLPELSKLNSLTNGSFNIGTLDLYRAFKAGDKRRDLIRVFIRNKSTDSASANFYYVTWKFFDNPPSSSDGENNWIVIRYADVLLLYAEALNEQEKSALALEEVNKVRTRAGVRSLAKTLGKEQTRAAIKKERRLELCYEGHRWPDLVRWGDFMDVLSAFSTKYWRGAFTPKEFNKLFPIPNREIVINPALTQNTGYY